MSIVILTGDFRELSAGLADDSIDLVLTDPPYSKEFLPLWADLARLAARVLKPSGFLVAYSGHIWLDQVIVMLREHLSFYTTIATDEPGGHSRINARAMFQEWKPVLIYCKEPLKRVAKWGPNKIASPAASKKYHRWGQSPAPVRELVERFSEPGDLVLDPMCGGGTTALACLLTNRRCICYELDTEAADVARRRIERERLFVASFEPVQLAFGDSNVPRCRACGNVLDTNGGPGRKRRYCSDACKQLAYRNRQDAVLRNE